MRPPKPEGMASGTYHYRLKHGIPLETPLISHQERGKRAYEASLRKRVKARQPLTGGKFWFNKMLAKMVV